MVPSLFVPPELPTVTAPETVKDGLPELAKVKIPVAFPLLLTCKEEQAALVTFTVTVIPELIVTASAEVGTDDPPQVAVLFQLPETVAVR